MRGKIPGGKLEMVVSYFMKGRKIIDIRTYEEEFFNNYLGVSKSSVVTVLFPYRMLEEIFFFL